MSRIAASFAARVRVAALAPALALILAAPAHAAATGKIIHTYVKVDDGTSIALCIWEPPGLASGKKHKWPALFEMDGYQGCPSPNDNEFFGHTTKFVDVYAQLRGSGCSGGQLDLFSRRSALDGKYIIDNWMRKQPWSNHRIGITGHSYSGLTGFQVAGTSPHVQAIALSGLINDFYRDILYPGGVFNEGFPVLWGAILRPASEFSGNTQNYNDPTCAANQAQHQGSDTVPAQLITPVYTQMTAASNTWAIEHSLFQIEPGLSAPTQINQQYQDEQTGPRGGYILWQHIPKGLPKRLVLSNGQHNPNDAADDKGAWLTCWLIDRGRHCPRVTGENAKGKIIHPRVNNPRDRVLMYFDSLRTSAGGQKRNRPYLTGNWPAPETKWTQYPLKGASYVSTTSSYRTTGTLGNPVGNPPSDNLGAITFTGGPDEARYIISFNKTTAVSGPALLDLTLSSSSVDTDVFADLVDYNSHTGQMEYLQRGLLRASFRAIDEAKSDRIQTGPFKGTVYRPYHDYLVRQLLTPAQPYDLPVEIFPLGHVFYPGHELLLDIHAPPVNDPISTYAYEPLQTPGVNTIVKGTLLLPLMRTLPPLWATQPSCNQISGYVCFSAR